MSPHIDTAWQAVCDLEGSIVKVADLMHALQLLAPSLGCDNSGAVFTIGTLAEDICADLKSPKGGRRVGGKVRVPCTSSQYDNPFFLKMPYCSSSYIWFTDLIY